MHSTTRLGLGRRATLLLGTALPAAFAVAAQDGCSLLPPPVETYSDGRRPTLVEFADLDGDRHPDLIVNAIEGLVVRPNRGDGVFDDPIGIHPTGGLALIAADFDGDGDLDIATADADGVTILINAGGFAFNASEPLAVEGMAYDLAAADLDGDGDLDLVARGIDSSYLTRVLNDGAGGFDAPVAFDAGASIGGVAIGDVTGDGVPDAVVGLALSASVLPGEGDGLFGPAVALAAIRVRDVALWDIDADGDLDIMLFRPTPDALAWLENLGDGGFAMTEGPQLADEPFTLKIADADRDGASDVIFDVPRLGAIGVVRLRADGSFVTPAYFSVGSTPPPAHRPVDIAVADIDMDGDVDVATANDGSNSVSVLMNVGGRFHPYGAIITQATEAILTVDLTGDGRAEVVSSGEGFEVFRALPDGQLVRGQKLPKFADRLAAGDIDGDGDQDIIAYDNFLQPGIHAMFNIGGGLLEADTPRLRITGVGDLDAADVDGDGLADLAFVDLFGDRVVLLRGRGDGTFVSGQAFNLGDDHVALAFADMNADGQLDLILATGTPRTSGSTPAMHVLLNDGTGALTALPADPGPPTQELMVADIDGDGALDVATIDGVSITVRWNDGDGRFEQHTSVDAPGVTALAAGDIDGTGFVEILGIRGEEPRGELLAWPMTREAFGTPSIVALPAPPWSIRTADLDQDGRADALVGSRGARYRAERLMVFSGRPPCTAPCPADLDADGVLTIFDFLVFFNLFDAGDPIADFDGDGELTIFDFLAFQATFDIGCE